LRCFGATELPKATSSSLASDCARSVDLSPIGFSLSSYFER
jgi:hypothetical protein